MKPFPKAMALLVAFSLSLPSPAGVYAACPERSRREPGRSTLRTREAAELPETRSGLEEALRTSPDAALHEIGRTVRSLLPKPSTPPIPAAGLEEGVSDAVRRWLGSRLPQLSPLDDGSLDRLIADSASLPSLLEEKTGKIKAKMQAKLPGLVRELEVEIQTTRQALAKEAQEHAASLTPKGRSEWFRQWVLPGFKQLAKTNLSDFSQLETAGKYLREEQDRQEWSQVLLRMRKRAVEKPLSVSSDWLDALMGLVTLSNREWFTQRGLLVLPTKYDFRDAVSLASSLGIAQINREQSLLIGGQPISLRYIRMLFAPVQGLMLAAWDRFGRQILVWEDQVESHGEIPWKARPQPNLAQGDALRQQGGNPDVYRARGLFLERFRNQYNDGASHGRVRLEAALNEEIGHALDTLHLEETGKGTETLLQTTGILRQIWETPVPEGAALPDSKRIELKEGLLTAFLEFSGQLRSAAATSDPHLLVDRWLYQLQFPIQQVSGPEYLSAHLGLLFLARELKLTQETLSPGNWYKVDGAAIAGWALQMLEIPPAQIRLAIRRIYAQEFVHPVDEAPLPEVNAEGNLIPRVPAAGMEEEFKQFPRLLASGRQYHAGDQSVGTEQLRLYYRNLLSPERLAPTGMMISDVKQILQTVEAVEQELKRQIPSYLPDPPFASVELIMDPEADFIASCAWRENTLLLNLHPNPERSPLKPWATSAPYLVGHELGESMIAVGPLGTQLERLSQGEGKRQRQLTLDFITQGFPGHFYLRGPVLSPEHRTNDDVLFLLGSPYGSRDLVADIIATRLLKTRLVTSGFIGWYISSVEAFARSCEALELGESAGRYVSQVIAGLGTAAVYEAIAEAVGDTERASQVGKAAERILLFLERDPLYREGGKWRSIYQVVLGYYRSLTKELEIGLFSPPEAGLKEGREEPSIENNPSPTVSAASPSAPRAMPPSPAGGLEERNLNQILPQLADSIQGAGVVVLGPEALESRTGLEELVRRAPPDLLKRMVFYAVGTAWAIRLRELNPAAQVIADNDLGKLAALLISLPEADRVTVLGTLLLAQQLQRLLPATMAVTHLDPAVAFRLILAALGVPNSVLNQVDAAGLEEGLARARAA